MINTKQWILIIMSVFVMGFYLGSLIVKEEIYRGNFILYKGGILVYKIVDIKNIK